MSIQEFFTAHSVEVSIFLKKSCLGINFSALIFYWKLYPQFFPVKIKLLNSYDLSNHPFFASSANNFIPWVILIETFNLFITQPLTYRHLEKQQYLIYYWGDSSHNSFKNIYYKTNIKFKFFSVPMPITSTGSFNSEFWIWTVLPTIMLCLLNLHHQHLLPQQH